MADVAAVLSEHSLVAFSQVITEIAFFMHPFGETLHHATEIFQTIVRSLHHIVTQILGEGKWIVVVALTTKPQATIACNGLYGEVVKRFTFFQL